MTRRAWRVGLGQLGVSLGDKPANLREIEGFVHLAAAQRVDVLALPECSLAGWLSPSARRAAEPIPGPFTRRLGALAKRYRMALVVGMEERAGGRIYNSAVFLDRAGRILGRHRKVNELEIGLEVYTRGDGLGVFDFEGRKVGLSICADSWTAAVTDALHLMGAEVVFSPSAWAVDPGKERKNIAWIRANYRRRTKGRKLLIVAPNGVGPLTEGPWKGKHLQGNSLVTGPGGKLLLQGSPHAGLEILTLP